MAKVQQGSTSAVILNAKNEILFVQRSSNESFLPNDWELPGGGMEYGETPQEALKREIREECGLDIEVIKPVAVSTYFIGEVQRIEIAFLCRADSPTALRLSHEHSASRWVKQDDIHTMQLNDYILNIIRLAKESID